MIHTPRKRFQVSFWVWSRDDHSEPGFRLEVDDENEARAAFEAQRQAGVYREGLFLDWQKDRETWFLVDSYKIK